MSIYGNPSPGAALKIGSDYEFFKYGHVMYLWDHNLMLISKNPLTNCLKCLFRVLFPFKSSYKVIIVLKVSYLMLKMDNFQNFRHKFHFDFGMIS